MSFRHPHTPWSALSPGHKGCASPRPSSHFKQCDTTIWSWERQKQKTTQLCPKTKYLKTSMLTIAVKHLKICGSLRNNWNCIAQLSIANPKDLRPFTWRKARAWNCRSVLRAPNHNSVGKTAHPVFQETLHMWEIKFSQARTSELLSGTRWITRIFREVKEKLGACLLKSNCYTNVLISQVSQISIAALIRFPALYFQWLFGSVAFHCIY